jgi:hypothetical protein
VGVSGDTPVAMKDSVLRLYQGLLYQLFGSGKRCIHSTHHRYVVQVAAMLTTILRPDGSTQVLASWGPKGDRARTCWQPRHSTVTIRQDGQTYVKKWLEPLSCRKSTCLHQRGPITYMSSTYRYHSPSGWLGYRHALEPTHECRIY